MKLIVNKHGTISVSGPLATLLSHPINVGGKDLRVPALFNVAFVMPFRKFAGGKLDKALGTFRSNVNKLLKRFN